MEDSRMPGNAETPQESGGNELSNCSVRSIFCCISQDENRAPLANNGGRKDTTPHATVTQQPTPSPPANNGGQKDTTPQATVTQQPTPSPPGNNGGSWDKTGKSTENPQKPPETTETRSNIQEKATQRTKSNQVEPKEIPSDYNLGKSFSFEGKLEQMRRAMKGKSLTQKVKVGIFSRATDSEYQWLKANLESESFVRSVQPCYISNNGFREFQDNVSHCDFGILYHSLNRGRVNLTDVTDSLYDEELEYMSEKLGKKNVIVVIDDLKDISNDRREQILNDQPKLRSLATGVFLISGDENKKK